MDQPSAIFLRTVFVNWRPQFLSSLESMSLPFGQNLLRPRPLQGFQTLSLSEALECAKKSPAISKTQQRRRCACSKTIQNCLVGTPAGIHTARICLAWRMPCKKNRNRNRNRNLFHPRRPQNQLGTKKATNQGRGLCAPFF